MPSAPTTSSRSDWPCITTSAPNQVMATMYIMYSPVGSMNTGQTYSPLARMLPFLEQNSIYNSINFNVAPRWGASGSDIVSAMNGSTADCDQFGLMNASAAGNQITTFSARRIPIWPT